MPKLTGAGNDTGELMIWWPKHRWYDSSSSVVRSSWLSSHSKVYFGVRADPLKWRQNRNFTKHFWKKIIRNLKSFVWIEEEFPKHRMNNARIDGRARFDVLVRSSGALVDLIRKQKFISNALAFHFSKKHSHACWRSERSAVCSAPKWSHSSHCNRSSPTRIWSAGLRIWGPAKLWLKTQLFN